MSAARGSKRRSRSSLLLAVIGGLLLPLAVTTGWIRSEVLETDRYVDTVGPLADDPAVQVAITDRLTTAIGDAADLGAFAEDRLPQNAQALAPMIEAGGNALIARVTEELVSSDEFARFWSEANRVAHGALVDVLTGRDRGALVGGDGRVVLDLRPVAERVASRVDERLGTDVSGRVAASERPLEFVLIDSEDLADVQALVELLDRVSWLTLVLAIACLVLAVLLAEDRRSGLRRAGIAIVASSVVTLVVLGLARRFYIDQLPPEVEHPDAAAAIFDILTQLLRRALRVLFAVGALMLVVSWILGRDIEPVRRFASEHLRNVRIAIVGAATLLLVVWDRPTGLVVITIAAIALIGLATVQSLTLTGRPPPPIAAADE